MMMMMMIMVMVCVVIFGDNVIDDDESLPN